MYRERERGERVNGVAAAVERTVQLSPKTFTVELCFTKFYLKKCKTVFAVDKPSNPSK